MVNLDGSHGEGGGQMLRTALVWSLITKTPFRMEKIRAHRDRPGLKAQHVQVLKALLPLGPVSFTGAVEGSAAVTFAPADLRAADYTVDIGTAGSITLLLQTLLPVALLANGRTSVKLIGGTDVAWSPPVDYLRNVLLGPAMRRAGHMRVDVQRRGFYPRGGGRVLFEAAGWKRAAPFDWVERGALIQIRILSVASQDLAERRVAERQADAAEGRLRRHGVPILREVTYGESYSTGSVVTCVADLAGDQKVGGTALGERAKRAEDVGREAADRLAAEINSGAPVDEYAADQFIVWLALAGGAMRVSRFSEHTRTNIWVTEQFLGKVFEAENTILRCIQPFQVCSSPSC